LSAAEVGEFHREHSTRPRPESSIERFRDVSDLITLSDVYFNRRGTLALTAISTWCGPLCASYLWKVFDKLDNGKWEERRWIMCGAGAENWNVRRLYSFRQR